MLANQSRAQNKRNLAQFHFKKTYKKLPLGGGSPGSDNLGQTNLNLCSHLTCHPPNNLKSEISNFFLIEGNILTGFLEVFHSSIAQSAGELRL